MEWINKKNKTKLDRIGDHGKNENNKTKPVTTDRDLVNTNNNKLYPGSAIKYIFDNISSIEVEMTNNKNTAQEKASVWDRNWPIQTNKLDRWKTQKVPKR